MAQRQLTPLGSALAGALGAVFSNAVVYPLDTVKTRLQALPPAELQAITHPKSKGKEREDGVGKRKTVVEALLRALAKRTRQWAMLSMLIRIVRTEGVAGTFKGFSANMINTFSQQFAYFFFHTFLRASALARSPDLSTAAELLLGAAAGGLAQIFTIPVAVVATRQQLHISGEDGATPSPGLLDTAREVVDEGGVTALWTGLRPGLVLTVNPAITYGVFEKGKSVILAKRGGGNLGVAEAFWLGVMSKTLATVVTYPYIFAKVRLQAKAAAAADAHVSSDESYAAVASQPPAEQSAVVPADKPASDAEGAPVSMKREKKQRGAIALLADVYREHGLAGWYQGMTAQIVKAVLCQGILFVSKDQFENYAATLLQAVGKRA